MKFRLLFLFLIGFVSLSMAQCALYEVPFTQRIDQSVIIVEGKVTQSSSYWRATPHNILTSNLITVYKVLKGNFSATQLEVITLGGVVEMNMEVVTPSLKLRNDQVGIFCLIPNSEPPVYTTGQTTYEAFADAQGFIKFDTSEHSASDPFHKYSDIQTELYDVILNRVGVPFNILQTPDYSISSQIGIGPPPTPSAISITSFTPASLHAGTFDTLTINGSGFGTNSGSAAILFSNGDDGGASFISSSAFNIISWSATQIKVLVPDGAGTGTFKVQDSGGSSQSSPSSLTVIYDELNITYNPGTGTQEYQTRHINHSGSGGYIFQYNVTFNGNASAKAAFLRAMQSWRCASFINYSVSATTSLINTSASDGINIVTWDTTGSTLPSGVLGVCSSYYSGCSNAGVVKWAVSELDVKFKRTGTDGITWNLGPAATPFSQYDLESVFLHELGHGEQLGHVINSVDVMHYAISNGTDHRTLDLTSDVAGGLNVMTRSVVARGCGTGAMTALSACSCSLVTNGGAGTWTWTGATSTDWFCPSNWDVSTLPDASSDVVIPGGTSNNPTITGATANCKTLSINTTAGGAVTISTATSGQLQIAQ